MVFLWSVLEVPITTIADVLFISSKVAFQVEQAIAMFQADKLSNI